MTKMLIFIKRIWLESGMEDQVLVNTNYVISIQKNYTDTSKPNTRVVMWGFGNEPNIFYTNESLATIKGKLTRAQNKNQEVD